MWKRIKGFFYHLITSEYQELDRISRLEVFCKKAVLRNFSKFTKIFRTHFFIEHLLLLLLDLYRIKKKDGES